MTIVAAMLIYSINNPYGHQTWQVGGLLQGLVLIKYYDPLITWSSEIT